MKRVITRRIARPALCLLAASALLGGCAGKSRSNSLEESRAASTTASKPGSAAPAGNQIQAPKTRDMDASVKTLLNGYERVPTEQDWKKLGPGALASLDRLIAAPETLPSVRSRAISSLAHVQNPEAMERLETLVATPSLDPQLRATAVLALATRAGQPAQPTLAPLLEDKSPRVREAAARALGRLGSPAARQVLEERLPLEKDAVVRDAIQAGLSQAQP